MKIIHDIDVLTTIEEAMAAKKHECQRSLDRLLEEDWEVTKQIYRITPINITTFSFFDLVPNTYYHPSL